MHSRRFAHLVGTLPYPDEEAAMAAAMALLGERLRTLPDGEVGQKTERHEQGERLGWIQWVVERFDDNPAFRLVKEGRYESKLGLWADYESGVRYKLQVPVRKLYDHLDFGFVEYFEHSWAVFQRMCQNDGRDDLCFQVGVPGALAIALFALGPLHGLRARHVFEERLAHECNRIHERAGDRVVFQIEVPVELGFYLKAPALMKPVVLRLASGWVTSLVEKLHPGARVGVHLCFGDLNNRPFTKVNDVEPLVMFTNAIAERWPSENPFDFVHFPFAMANIAPPLEPSFYAALSHLALPEETRFIAGFVHEGRSPAEHDRILELVQERLDRTVDISSACGLGRRDREAGERLMREAARLVG